MSCGGSTVAIEWGAEPPVLAVICDREGDPPGLRFFSVVWSDAPPEDVERDETSLSCVHCVLESFPELSLGLGLAVEHGAAVRDPLTGERSVGEDGFAFEDVLRARERLGR